MTDSLRIWLLTTVSTLGGHYYLSTACLHGDHGYCAAPVVMRDGQWRVVGPSYCSEPGEAKQPAACKFCSANCRCRCHR